MIINSEYIIECLCAAFTAAGIATIPWHGDSIDYDMIKTKLENNESNFYAGFNMDRTDELYKSDGYFLAGVLMPFCYDVTARDVIDKMNTFLLLGLNDDLTEKKSAPFLINNMQFYKWNPLELAGHAEVTQSYYFIENRIEITFNLGGC